MEEEGDMTCGQGHSLDASDLLFIFAQLCSQVLLALGLHQPLSSGPCGREAKGVRVVLLVDVSIDVTNDWIPSQDT